MIELTCSDCSKSFSVKPCRRLTANYCSQLCARTNKSRRQKMSEFIKKNPIPNSQGTRFTVGHQHADATRAKMRNLRPNAKIWNRKPPAFIDCAYCSVTTQIKPTYVGRQKYCSKPCADKGRDRGLTSLQKKLRTSLRYSQWRTSVFERDDYTCQACHTRGGVLNADHIKRFADYPDLRFDLSNGQTLCESCHRATPTYGNRLKRCMAQGSA